MLTQRMQQAFSHTTSELSWMEGSDATMQQGVFQRVPKFWSWEGGWEMLTQQMQQAFSYTTPELSWMEGSDATMQQ